MPKFPEFTQEEIKNININLDKKLKKRLDSKLKLRKQSIKDAEMLFEFTENLYKQEIVHLTRVTQLVWKLVAERVSWKVGAHEVFRDLTNQLELYVATRVTNKEDRRTWLEILGCVDQCAEESLKFEEEDPYEQILDWSEQVVSQVH